MAGKCGRQKTKEERESLTKRNCLRCQNAFKSEGIHNRLCEGCKRGEGATRGVTKGKFSHSNTVGRKGPYT